MTGANEPRYKAELRRRQNHVLEQQQEDEQAVVSQEQKVEQVGKEEQAERLRLFGEYRNEQLTRQRSNAEKFDNTILTYSTGGLALSITFIKDVVPLASAHSTLLLKSSWVLFGLSMLLMLLSFPIGSAENEKSINYAHKFYMERDDTFYNKKSWQTYILSGLNLLALGTFICAVVFTTWFVWINVKEQPSMTDTTDKKPPTPPTLAMDGTSSAKMSPMVNLQGGIPSAKMHSINTTAQSSAPASTASTAPTAPTQPSKSGK